MSLRIAIIGEGKNDYGWHIYGEWQEGTVQVFLRKLLEGFDLDFTSIYEKKAVVLGRGRYRKEKLKGAAKKVLPFLKNYQKEKFDLLIFYSDSDKMQRNRATKIEALKNYQAKKEEIVTGLELVKNTMNLQGVIMMPIRMIENWLLSDANAFKELFDEIPRNPKLPKEPEFIWGNEQDRESNHPKNYLRRVLEQYKKTSHTEIFKEIAEHIEVETIMITCENSFKPFYEELQKFMEQYKN